MSLKIVMISDTHEQEEKIILPPGDVLIHAGDITNRGDIAKLAKFAKWLEVQNFKHKIVISGNHDLCFQNSEQEYAKQLITDAGGSYLQDSGITINDIMFWGTPWQPKFNNDWAFNFTRGQEAIEKWALIPNETNVLITHGPPHSILDSIKEGGHAGCRDLLNRVSQLEHLKLHAFGHLHADGCTSININNTTYVNGAMCDEDYRIHRVPIVVEI